MPRFHGHRRLLDNCAFQMSISSEVDILKMTQKGKNDHFHDIAMHFKWISFMVLDFTV